MDIVHVSLNKESRDSMEMEAYYHVISWLMPSARDHMTDMTRNIIVA